MAQPQFDQGLVDGSYELGYVTLVIAPSPSQQAALNQLLLQQQDRSSANFHKWLTPEQYADRFGMSPSDAVKITGWLESQGLTVLQVPPGRNSVIFSGTAAQVQVAFNTEIHRYDVNGESHVANSTPISLPAALSGVVTGVRGIADFRPKPMYARPVPGNATGPHPHYTTTIGGSTEYFIAPGDIATIYDLNPLYNASTPIDGTGQKLAIIGQTDIYIADLADFRTGFGLNPISGCTTSASGIITACDSTNFKYVLVPGITDPGAPSTCGDILESDLDIEWSGAVARNAQVIFVNAPATFNAACTEMTNGGGVNNALAYAIQQNIAPVISMSYGNCEAESDSLETELVQANSQGITVLNSAGDTGSAECDFGPPNNAINPPFAGAVGGLAVSYPASSPEVTGVGGTSIPLGDYTSAFWSASNGSFGASALSALIGQEVSWNDDAAFAQLCAGDSSNIFCTVGGSPAVSGWKDITSAEIAQEDIWISIGGGGVSNCFNETGDICTSGFPLPTWQQGITIPALTSPQSTYRFVPDVSLLASPNFPGYIICTPQNALSSKSTSATSSCVNGISTAVDTYLSLVGGTSVSTPVFAGIVALMNQYLGKTGLSNINPTLYALAATPANGVFHTVDNGDSNVYCQTGTPTGQPADVICPSAGVFGFSAANADAATGYNLVTGLGSVDANALAIAWRAFLTPDFQLSTPNNPQPVTVAAGASASVVLTITPISGSTPAVINFSPSSCAGLPTGASCSFNPTSVNFTGTSSITTTLTISTLPTMAPSNAQNVTITPVNPSNVSTSVSLTVTKTTETFSISTNAATFQISPGGTASVSIAVSSSTGFINTSNNTTAVPVTYSCSGIPTTAEIACNFTPGNGQAISQTAVTLNLVTTAATSQSRPPLGHASHVFYALLLPSLFGIVLLGGSRTRGVRLLGLIVVLGFSTLWLGACGGGSNSSQKNPGTPAGSYQITVNATTAGAVPIANTGTPLTITLTVN